jgi:predicted anti-sigma-YlaC factor YlaD
MRCEQAGEMMSERLDGRLDPAGMVLLEEHLAACSTCQDAWRRLQMLDDLLASAPMVQAPVRLRVGVMARLSRREQARRAITGGTALALGTVALTLLALAPLLLNLLGVTGIAPVLISGGPATIVQLLALLGAVCRTLLVLLESFAAPLVFLGVCSLAVAIALNRLWVGVVGRMQATR